MMNLDPPLWQESTSVVITLSKRVSTLIVMENQLHKIKHSTMKMISMAAPLSLLKATTTNLSMTSLTSTARKIKYPRIIIMLLRHITSHHPLQPYWCQNEGGSMPWYHPCNPPSRYIWMHLLCLEHCYSMGLSDIRGLLYGIPYPSVCMSTSPKDVGS